MITIDNRAGVWRAPGRANLMGEHTDYNRGLVLPFAIAQGVTAAASRDDGMLVVRSRQKPGEPAVVALNSLSPGGVCGWAAYPAGIAWALREAGHRVPAATIDIDSDLAAGAGLSSSAALECATLLALTGLAGASIPPRELVEISRRAENDFVGVPNGIMDQSASLLCTAGHALLLDCGTLEIFQVPFDPGAAGAGLLIVNTRARHAHAGGDYARRRAECEEAARQLGVRFLGSLIDADVTVDEALAAGALGARMIGGGFGGSVLVLVPTDAEPAVRAAIADAFARHDWASPEFIETSPSRGADCVSTGHGI